MWLRVRSQTRSPRVADPSVRTQAVAVRSYCLCDPQSGRCSTPRWKRSQTLRSDRARSGAGRRRVSHQPKRGLVRSLDRRPPSTRPAPAGAPCPRRLVGTSAPPGYLKPVADPYDAAGGANPNTPGRPRCTRDWPAARVRTLQPGAFRDATRPWDAGSLWSSRRWLLHTAAAIAPHGLRADARPLGFHELLRGIIQVTLNTNPKPVRPGGRVTVTGRVWPRPTGAVRLMPAGARNRCVVSRSGQARAGQRRAVHVPHHGGRLAPVQAGHVQRRGLADRFPDRLVVRSSRARRSARS